MKTLWNDERGFTIIEILIALSLSAIILTSFVHLYTYCGKTTTWQIQGAEANRDARLAMMRIDKDFRSAGLIASQDVDGDSNDISRDVLGQVFSDSSHEIFEEAKWNTFTFEADVDNDSMTETVRYYMDGTDLKRYVWVWSRDSLKWRPKIPGRPVGTNVDFVMIQYYDANNIQIPNPTPIPYSSITLTPQERAGIRTIKIDYITKSSKENTQKIHTGNYPDGTTYCDGYTRQHLTSIIKCRNLQ
jgi:prepilin-type N-terminal cleavage/methylation domain-containing protein